MYGIFYARAGRLTAKNVSGLGWAVNKWTFSFFGFHFPLTFIAMTFSVDWCAPSQPGQILAFHPAICIGREVVHLRAALLVYCGGVCGIY